MEFYYTGIDGTEQGPFNESQMTYWLREYNNFHEDMKIRFEINGKPYNTTLARMRVKNGYCTPFIFAKCERVDKEKELRKEIEAAASSTQNIEKAMEEVRKSIAQTSLQSRQLMERMQRKIDAATATADRVKRAETSTAPATPPVNKDPPHQTKTAVPAAPTVSAAPPPPTKAAANNAVPAASAAIKAPPPPLKAEANEPSTSKTPRRTLPLYDVSPFTKTDIGEDRESIKTFRNALEDIDLNEAQRNLKFPIFDKCRGCDVRAVTETNLRAWLCHITSKNHIDKFRLRGGRVSQQCLDWYLNQLAQFPKAKKEEGTVDLEKKKCEWYFGVIMLPVHVPLLHIDPADTTWLSPSKGRQELGKLRSLIFGPTDRYTASKSFYLPTTSCEVCNEKFNFTPNIVPHFLSNTHVDKYLAKRGSFSQHDFDFWTAICKLFPEAGKDTRDPKAVRAQLKDKAKILDISSCKNSLHYTIYGGEDRRKHVVDFIKKQLVEHQRPVVVYTLKEEEGRRMMEYVKEQLPETRVGWANCTEECEELEVIVTDSTLRLTRPYALAFPFAPLDVRQKADYAQKMCAENVEANVIIAFGQDEPNELRKFSRGAAVPFSAPYPPPLPTQPTVLAPITPTPNNLPITVPTVRPSVVTAPASVSIVPQMMHAPPPRPTPPVASVPPFGVSTSMPSGFTPTPRSNPNPTVPPNQRRYDPNQFDKSPTPESKKSNCAMM